MAGLGPIESLMTARYGNKKTPHKKQTYINLFTHAWRWIASWTGWSLIIVGALYNIYRAFSQMFCNLCIPPSMVITHDQLSQLPSTWWLRPHSAKTSCEEKASWIVYSFMWLTEALCLYCQEELVNVETRSQPSSPQKVNREQPSHIASVKPR